MNDNVINNETDREKSGLRSSILGIAVNVLIATMKLVAGILSSSIAIIADAVNNFSDAGASGVTFVSFKMASKPADKDHPFGHARIEYVCSMIVSFLILIVGFEFFSESLNKIFNKDTASVADFTIISFSILAFSIIAKLWLSLYNYRVGKKINSQVLKATAIDSLADAFSTFAVMICGIIVKYTGFALLDSIVGILVSLLIMFAGIKILNETKNSILGEAPVEDTVLKIKAIVAEYPEVLGVHDLMVHNYGPDKYIASFHAEVNGKTDVFLLHDTIDLIERRIHEELSIPCTIHMDPIETDNETLNKLKSFVESEAKAICDTVGIHDFRAVIGVTHTNLIFDIVVPFDASIAPDKMEELIKERIAAQRPDCFCVITVDRE